VSRTGEAAAPGRPWWGAALSSTQVEGASPGSDWARWEAEGRAPASGDGNGFATGAAEDVSLLAGAGLRALRLSVDWSRLEPEEGRVDGAEVERWQGLLATARAEGAEVWLGLQHVALPGWFLDEGSFPDDKARSRYWDRHVDRCGEAFGDLVAGWFPIDQPSLWAEAGYRFGRRPPGTTDAKATGEALRGIALAWRDAWRLLRGGGPLVATSLDLPLLRAADDTVPAREMARLAERLTWGVWVAALRDGVLDVPGRAEEVVDDLQGSADVVGVTYRGGLANDGEGTRLPRPRDVARTATGDTVWPAGLGEALQRLGEALPDRRLLVARVGVGTTDDGQREDLLRALDAELVGAAADGVGVEGAFYGSAIDAYEWEHGFAVPFGLFDRDRAARPSLEALRDR
jgi:beta-glucosidase